ncbi:unnamed protein product [Orchesella dallaii]|uniref:DOMON domain-containing protein n=1 Tax=Orchesella dallaii TaxID=48710 RepID=A0ABP1RFV8_9HEXA
MKRLRGWNIWGYWGRRQDRMSSTSGYLVDNNPYRQWEMLDNDGKYELEWIVNWEENRILFNVTVQTKGYVGFGLSPKGKRKMSGADLVIGGVMPDGRPYFTDRHAIGNQLPELDDSQDWTLHEARENSTHTFMSFSRLFETCDGDHDLPIHGDVIGLIWAFGEKDDEIEYHFHNRGLKYAYLLNPELIPREMEPSYRAKNPDASLGHDFNQWTISKSEIMPQQPTTYTCTIHKAPVISTKQHIVGAS